MKMVLFTRSQAEALLHGETVVLSRKRRRTGYALKENIVALRRLEDERKALDEKIAALRSGAARVFKCDHAGCDWQGDCARSLGQHRYWKHKANGKNNLKAFQDRKKAQPVTV